MKITVINGSPKGEYSVTYHSAKYIEALSMGKHEFKEYHVGQRIISLEKNKKYLHDVLRSMTEADLILWIYPVYTFLVPYQLIKFIEIISDCVAVSEFKGKYTTQISTSHHFYDHTAYNYLLNICEDWGMNIIPGHIANMDDLKKEAGQNRLKIFLKEIELHVESRFLSIPKYAKSNRIPVIYQPENVSCVSKHCLHNISLITDCQNPDSNQQKMIDTLVKVCPNRIRVLNINNISIKSGCIGCMYCTIEGKCVIKDDHQESFLQFINNADCVIYALEINNHSFGSRFKKFVDRQFSNGHRISSMGKPVAYLVSGNLSNEPNLREIIEGRCEVGGLYLCGIVTDETESALITHNINSLAKKIMWSMEQKAERPASFLGVGGMKVFRDLIYSMQGFMLEDHRFYKRHKLYDFPQHKKAEIFRSYLLGLAIKPQAVRKRVMPRLKKELVKGHQKVVNDIKCHREDSRLLKK